VVQPRIKAGHDPERMPDGMIRIGPRGASTVIRHQAEWVWPLLQAMDGTRTVAGLVAVVTAAYGGARPDHVQAAVEQLIREGFVYDAAAPVPAELAGYDLQERYRKPARYYAALDRRPEAVSVWRQQARLLRSKVTLVGVGGAGGVAALELAAAGVGELHLVDPDHVELPNLSRQIVFAEDDIGNPKVDAAAVRLYMLNSGVKVTRERTLITGPGDLLPLARDCDVLLLTADRPRALPGWANEACLAEGRPWVDAGYQGLRVQAGAYQPGTGPCRACVFDTWAQTAADRGILAVDPQDRPAVTAAVPTAMAGAMAAHLVIGLLTGSPPVSPGVQAIHLTSAVEAFCYAPPARPDCPACGTPA
jgi:molybdopterin-synthase adenylyltransferase